MQSRPAIRPVAIQLMRLLLLCATAVIPMKGHAEKFGDPTIDLGAARSTDHGEPLAKLQSVANIRQVDLFLSWPHQLRSAPLTEQTLPNERCEYRTDDAAQIATIAEALRSAAVEPSGESVDRSLEKMITFEFKDGSTLRVVFGEVLQGDGSIPAATLGANLVVKEAFGDELLHWAAGFYLKNRCSGFVDGR